MTNSAGPTSENSALLAGLSKDPSVKQLAGALGGMRRQLSRRILLVDFSDGCAVVAQCRLRGGSIELMPIDITELDKEALDKGCPTDPEAMADLLQDVIEERKMIARRCAVILPAVAFTTIPLCIEAGLNSRQALERLGEAGSAVQLPFPRNQADLELIDVSDRDDCKSNLHRSYLLMAVQRSHTDRLVKTFQQASLELQFVDSGLLAPLRLFQGEIEGLQPKQQLLHLNLAPGVTTCTTVGRGGPKKLQRLAPVRPYPLFMDQSNEDYFPLAPEDLLSLERDLKKVMKDSTNETTLITLGGTGSGHPGLDELLNEALEIPIKLIKPLDNGKIGSFELPNGFNAQAMGRIVGMALRCLHMEENPGLWATARQNDDERINKIEGEDSWTRLIKSVKKIWKATRKAMGEKQQS